MRHYCQQLLLKGLACWKVHHLGCVRKRVRQGQPAPPTPHPGSLVWWSLPGQEGASGEERSFLQNSQYQSGAGWSRVLLAHGSGASRHGCGDQG